MALAPKFPTNRSFRRTEDELMPAALGGARSVVPVQDSPLDQRERQREQHSEQTQHEHAAPHLRDLEAALELDDGVAEAVGGPEQLADDHHDDADGQRLTGADDDLRARR